MSDWASMTPEEQQLWLRKQRADYYSQWTTEELDEMFKGHTVTSTQREEIKLKEKEIAENQKLIEKQERDEWILSFIFAYAILTIPGAIAGALT